MEALLLQQPRTCKRNTDQQEDRLDQPDAVGDLHDDV